MAIFPDEETKPVFMYSALTLMLLIFIVQSGFGFVMNVLRNIDIYTKLQIVKKANITAINKNNTLKDETKSYNSAKSLESIARNNLKMAGENEVLLILNNQTPLEEKDKTDLNDKGKNIIFKRN